MKKNLLIFLINLLFLNLFSQETTCNLSSDKALNLFNCIQNNYNYKNSIGLENITNQILNKIGIPNANFKVVSCNSIENATAFIYNNERYIVADELFLNKLNNQKDNDFWFYLFILSHEVAHHLNGHTLKKEVSLVQNRKKELDCDRFAGLVLKKFGGTKSIIYDALKKLPHPEFNNSTHPIFNDRLKVAYEGFDEAENEEIKIVQKYENEIIQSTKYFEKLNIHLKANWHASKYFQSYNDNDLENAISYYKVSLNNYESNIALEGLAVLYSYKNDYIQSKKYYDLLFDKTKNDNYVIYSYNASYSGNLPFDKNLDYINYKSISDLSLLNTLFLYYNSKNETNKGIEILEFAYQKTLENQINTTIDKTEIISVLNNLCASYLNIGNYEKGNFYANILMSTFLEHTNSNDINSLVAKYINTNSSYQSKFLKNLLIDFITNVSIIKNFNSEYALSLNMLELLHQVDPNSKAIIDGRYNLFKGKNLLSLNRKSEAELEFNKLIDDNPDFRSYGYLYLGYINSGNEKFDKAIAYFEKSCNLGNSEGCSNAKLFKQIEEPKTIIRNIEDAINFLKVKKGGYDVKIYKYEFINNKWTIMEEDIGELYLDLQSIDFYKKSTNNWMYRELIYDSFDIKNNLVSFSSKYGRTNIPLDFKYIMFFDSTNENIFYLYNIIKPNLLKSKN